MSEDANQIETPTEAIADAPVSQPDQGGVTPAAAQAPETGSAQQAQGVQQPPVIPKHRFDEVNYRMQAAERELAQLRQAQTPQTKPAEPQAPKQEDFQTYEDYIRADARFVAQQEARQTIAQERQQQQQATQQQAEQTRAMTADQNWFQKTSEAVVKYPDFEQKMYAAPNITNDHTRAVLKASPMAGDLAYHLASNPDVIGRLNGMHPLDAAAELGRIEGKLQGSSGQPPPRKPSAGIPVLDAVGGGQKPGHKHTDQLSQEDVIKRLYPTS